MPRPQFSLKTMLWLTIVAAAFCAGTQLDRYLKDRADPSQMAIRKELDEKTDLDVAEQPLTDCIDYLKQRHNIEIQLDIKALRDAGVGSDAPITRSIKGVPLRSALKVMLDDLDLTYVNQKGVLIITTEREAHGDLYNLKTLLWIAIAVAVLLGAILVGRAWEKRAGAASPSLN
ncbi:MAG TPA: hypothetical protein VHC22_23415 [Pirellulales bacterium]|nr:hypothetical protein [Pirellulales bacterium]